MHTVFSPIRAKDDLESTTQKASEFIADFIETNDVTFALPIGFSLLQRSVL